MEKGRAQQLRAVGSLPHRREARPAQAFIENYQVLFNY